MMEMKKDDMMDDLTVQMREVMMEYKLASM